LAAVGKETDDVIYISGQVRDAILAMTGEQFRSEPILRNLHNRGRKADKHGNPWRVYELHHTQLVQETSPNR